MTTLPSSSMLISTRRELEMSDWAVASCGQAHDKADTTASIAVTVEGCARELLLRIAMAQDTRVREAPFCDSMGSSFVEWVLEFEARVAATRRALELSLRPGRPSTNRGCPTWTKRPSGHDKGRRPSNWRAKPAGPEPLRPAVL